MADDEGEIRGEEEATKKDREGAAQAKALDAVTENVRSGSSGGRHEGREQQPHE
jgi:hypothetical protein